VKGSFVILMGPWGYSGPIPAEAYFAPPPVARDEADRVFNCAGCGAHDFGLNRPHCPHCGYEEKR